MIETLLHIDFWALFIIALLANGLSSMAGGGSGMLQLPALLFLGLPFSVALATHKIATVALGIGSTLRYSQEKLFEWRFGIIILAFGLPGVIVGSVAIVAVSDALAAILLGVLTLVLGVYSFMKQSFGEQYTPKNRQGTRLFVGGAGIFAIGVLNGSLAAGAGLFATMWFVVWFGMDYKRAIAMTMILVGFFWNGTGAITLSLLSEVQWSWLPPLCLGSLLGSYFGAMFAVKKGNVFIKRLFETITIVTGISLIIKTIV